MLAVVLVAWFLLRYTRFGHHLYAIGGSEETARLSGVRSARALIGAHILCSLTSVLTGLFIVSRLRAGAPWVGPDGNYDLESIAAVVLGGTALSGGKGGVLGTVAGVLILALLDNLFNQLEVNTYLKDVLRGVIIVAAVAAYSSAQLSSAAHDHRRRRSRLWKKQLTISWRSASGDGVRGTAPIFLVLAFCSSGSPPQSELGFEPRVFLAFLKRAAPLMILAAGQLFVIVSGEFDLSVGSLVTVVVVAAAGLTEGDPDRTWWVATCCCSGILVGLVNGIVTTTLDVPSFITTLGMLLILQGAGLYWSGGAPRDRCPTTSVSSAAAVSKTCRSSSSCPIP